VIRVVAADHERVRTVPVDIACLHGAQLAYSLASTSNALPRYLVLPPAVFQALPQTELSVVFCYTLFDCRCFNAPERELRSVELREARVDLRDERDEFWRTTVALLLICFIISGLALIVLVSLVF